MSDNMPFEIQAEIIKRLPVKSLIQFRSVSKPWKSLIDSSKFIADYHLHHTHPQHLLLSYTDANDFQQKIAKDFQRKFVSIVDDGTFPQQKVSLDAPMSVKLLFKPKIISSSQGLLCVYGFNAKLSDSRTMKVVIWNPAVRKSVDIHASKVDWPYKTVIGFGVCPLTSDPKIVKITFNWNLGFRNATCIPWQVEVFALSSRVWRTPSTNPPRNSTVLRETQVDIDGFIYWVATATKSVDTELQQYNLILSFDMTSEKFAEVHLPDSLAHDYDYHLDISKLRGSVILLQTYIEAEGLDYGVWMMENGVPNSFTKLFTVRAPCASIRKVLGFRKGGEAIFEMIYNYDRGTVHFVYEPYSERNNHIGISGDIYSLFVGSYMETLLLLDH